jgi:hypothetical protein
MKRSGWRAVLEWALAFALLGVVVLGALTIGAFLLPVAVFVVAAVGLRNRVWPDAVSGLCIGLAALAIFVGAPHLQYRSCQMSGSAVARAGSGVHVRCSSRNGRAWVAVGGILALVGVGGYTASVRGRRISLTIDGRNLS